MSFGFSAALARTLAWSSQWWPVASGRKEERKTAPWSREWGKKTYVQALDLVIQPTLSPGKSWGLSGSQFHFLRNEGLGLVVREMQKLKVQFTWWAKGRWKTQVSILEVAISPQQIFLIRYGMNHAKSLDFSKEARSSDFYVNSKFYKSPCSKCLMNTKQNLSAS